MINEKAGKLKLIEPAQRLLDGSLRNPGGQADRVLQR